MYQEEAKKSTYGMNNECTESTKVEHEVGRRRLTDLEALSQIAHPDKDPGKSC